MLHCLWCWGRNSSHCAFTARALPTKPSSWHKKLFFNWKKKSTKNISTEQKNMWPPYHLQEPFFPKSPSIKFLCKLSTYLFLPPFKNANMFWPQDMKTQTGTDKKAFRAREGASYTGCLGRIVISSPTKLWTFCVTITTCMARHAHGCNSHMNVRRDPNAFWLELSPVL